VLGQMAGLDQRLAAHVDQSAEVVAAGRRNLDAVRQWVVDAAASVPPGQAGETTKMAIAQKGLSQLQEIIQKSNGELNSIGGKIDGLRDEYQALSNQKFANEGTGDEALGVKDDENKEEEAQKQAEEDVRKTLEEGDQPAAGRVEDVLGGIVPGQDLSVEQKAYLDQMASQQADMSVDDLKTAQDRLGDHKNVIGD
jgi:hypothetical protein